MVRYLIGDATDEERSQVEQRLFSDSEYFEELLALENALADEYVMGRMPASQRAIFEANMTASQRENVEFTRKLAGELSRAPQPKEIVKFPGKSGRIRAGASFDPAPPARLRSRRLTLAAAVSLMALVLVGLPMLFWNLSLRDRVDKAREEAEEFRARNEELHRHLENAEAERERLTKELEGERESRREAQDQLARLQERAGLPIPGLLRVRLDASNTMRGGSGELKLIKVGPDKTQVRFDILLDQPSRYISHGVSIGLGQRTVRQFTGVRARAGGRSISVTVAADLLEYQDYRLQVFGEREGGQPESIQTYVFRIEKQD